MLKKVKLIKKGTSAVESDVTNSLSRKLIEKKGQASIIEKVIEFTGDWVNRRRRQHVNARKAFAALFDKPGSRTD